MDARFTIGSCFVDRGWGGVGIGRASAERFAAEGAKVVGGRREPLRASGEDALPPRMRGGTAAGDAWRRHERKAVRAAVAEDRGDLRRLDVLVNAASIGGFAALRGNHGRRLRPHDGRERGRGFPHHAGGDDPPARPPGGNIVNIGLHRGQCGARPTRRCTAPRGRGSSTSPARCARVRVRAGSAPNCIAPGGVRTPILGATSCPGGLRALLIDYTAAGPRCVRRAGGLEGDRFLQPPTTRAS